MAAPHYRKVELQSPADFTYLYANTVALSRRKLDLYFPPSATDNDTPDPMRERVRELIDEYINKTFESASSSISINGIDSTSPQFPFPAAFTAPTEQVEYEAFDTDLASRVTSLYAQLESLNTTVAQQRRDAPRRAAKEYAAQLRKMIEEEEEEYENEDEIENGGKDADNDTEMGESADMQPRSNNENKNTIPGQETDGMDVDSTPNGTGSARSRRPRGNHDPAWTLQVALGTEEEQERWKSGDIASVYEDALRMLQRLQGEANTNTEAGVEGNALATTVGKAERAGRAAEVVENMNK
ncbi:Kinetochore Mis14 [Penicillium expansum]|uniref:Kinetochore Mis14 n=1 Tax=Penicillium expansum TaxID=27334 RepID=A0A0A2KWV2_PENEN|nr:Kinetochore Mis14 [Penicillium expansum]KGO42209.1 Kinetochore Mis14 [Penicillium expansum]KGO56250.1 Kinetochore Mis14 [Penicillium expansum]KGO68840.1 Kinetochore Mis14 [Penicillium expansum]